MVRQAEELVLSAQALPGVGMVFNSRMKAGKLRQLREVYLKAPSPVLSGQALQSRPAPNHKTDFSSLPQRSPLSPEVVVGELLQRVGLGAHLGLCRAQLHEPDNVLPLVGGHSDQGLEAEQQRVRSAPHLDPLGSVR